MKSSKLSLHLVSTIVFLALGASGIFAQSTQVTADLGRTFSNYDVVTVGTGASLEAAGGERKLSIRTSQKNFDLTVTPNDIRSLRYHAENTGASGVTTPAASEVNTFKGRIDGAAKSEVRLTIKGADIEGFFETGGERFFIEPAKKFSASAKSGESVVYKAEDVISTSPYFCDSDIASRVESATGRVAAEAAESMPTYRVIEMATEADLEYVQTLGGAAQANSEILSILNMVEGTYNADLGLSIRVVFQHTWTTTDPFAGGDNSTILNAFTNYWNTNYPNSSIPRDAAHLFTAKAPALSRGLAWVGVLCSNPQYAYGLSGHISWAPGKFLVPAHEIGHNLGGNHAEAGQNCANTLMNAQLSGTTPLSFCSYSQSEIGSFVNTYGSCLLPSASVAAAAFDFDGDGRSDQSVFRPGNSVWYINRSSAGFNALQFGAATDKPVSADFDGDGKYDPAVFRAGVWYRLKSATNTVDGFVFGLATDIPVPADLTGDGKAEIVTFRPSTGYWYWLASENGAFAASRFGAAGDVPLPADYDGDGKADINVFRPASGVWYRINSSNGATVVNQFGALGDKAVAGDYDGDGKTDVAVFRPSNGAWYVLRSQSNSVYGVIFGLGSDVPSPADFDGDGKTDISVFRQSDGIWYRLNSSNGVFVGVPFGQPADQPIQGFYVR